MCIQLKKADNQSHCIYFWNDFCAYIWGVWVSFLVFKELVESKTIKLPCGNLLFNLLFFWTPLHTTHCADRTWLERGNPWVGASKGNYGLPLGPFLNLDGLSHTASSETAAIWKRPNTLGGGRKPLRARPKHAFLIQFRLQQRRCFQMLNYF